MPSTMITICSASERCARFSAWALANMALFGQAQAEPVEVNVEPDAA